MAFQIKRNGAAGVVSHTEAKYEDAIRAAHVLISELVQKSHTTITNLKTGEIMNEAEIEEAALSVGPPKRRANAAQQS
jgi:hypothetical protein